LRLSKAIIFFFLYLILTNSTLAEKSKVIKKLNSINNIKFDFIQKTNEKIEKGECILVFPSKLKCNYQDKNKKELIVNKKIMAVTQKRYGKTLFYPLSKATFISILNKSELIKIINESNAVIDDYLNIVFINEDNSKTLIKFNRKDFLLAGWVSSDQYNNRVVFEIEITSINQMVDDKIFTLPDRG
tara:strand:+ start:264 stop:821 length:558 start_codon:yes stop_codon:yes gene_type:complete